MYITPPLCDNAWMSETFKSGAVVQLKSGGPLMTVNFVENEGGAEIASCSWFLKDKKESSQFPVSTLKLVPDSK
jgi:uncharacterized protein YodC (DUF2158 family)